MFRPLRRFNWFFRAFWLRYYRVIGVSLFLGISFFFFSSRYKYLLPQVKVTYKIGLVGLYTTDDLPKQLLDKITAGLVEIAPDGSASASLASNWEITENGTLYHFQLKKGLKWTDGTPLKASQIKLALKDIEITTADDENLYLKLKEPFSPFPTILTQPIFKSGLIGVGPFQVSSIKSSGQYIQSIRLEKPDSTLIYKFYPTEKAALLGFKLGEVDRLENLASLGDIANWQQIKITPTIAKDQFVAIFFNNKDPQLNLKTFRQALTYALEKPEGEARANGPLNSQSWAHNSQVKPYFQDLNRAKELLKESQVEEAKIELATTFSQLTEAEKIKKDWAAIGVQTEIKVVSSLPENFQAFLVSQKIPADPDQYTLWHSTQNTNITGYNNPKVDKLLEDGRRIEGREERKAVYLDFQRFLLEDCPAAFLFHPQIYTVAR